MTELLEGAKEFAQKYVRSMVAHDLVRDTMTTLLRAVQALEKDNAALRIQRHDALMSSLISRSVVARLRGFTQTIVKQCRADIKNLEPIALGEAIESLAAYLESTAPEPLPTMQTFDPDKVRALLAFVLDDNAHTWRSDLQLLALEVRNSEVKS